MLAYKLSVNVKILLESLKQMLSRRLSCDLSGQFTHGHESDLAAHIIQVSLDISNQLSSNFPYRSTLPGQLCVDPSQDHATTQAFITYQTQYPIVAISTMSPVGFLVTKQCEETEESQGKLKLSHV